MKIGYAMMYPYRGSIHNMIYIKDLLEKDGCESYYLTCDASVPYCYNRLIKGNNRLIECPKCILGGIRSFETESITSIKSKVKMKLSKEKLKLIVESTSFSLHRIETEDDCKEYEVLKTQENLYESASIVYANTESWIKENGLDIVFIFNGRLDLPSAVLHACKDNNIPFMTFEAAYPGIALTVNEDCRGLKSLNKLVIEYRDLPLEENQAKFAGKIVADMILKKNIVWRLYNTEPTKGKWGNSFEDKKVLIVPSSQHEFQGIDDWTSEWTDISEALESIIEKLGIDYNQCLIRCHPNWSDKIGINDTGYRSERFYKNWADNKGINIIPSNDTSNTIDLIKEADIVIVQGGTAGIEAGILGKKIIGVIPSWYSEAGFSIQVHSKKDLYRLEDLDLLNSDKIIYKTLRFIYTYHKRFAQYTEFVKPINIHSNKYYKGANARKILEAFDTGNIIADNSSVCDSFDYENEIITKIKDENWEELSNYEEKMSPFEEIKIERIKALKWLDNFRNFFKSGDM